MPPSSDSAHHQKQHRQICETRTQDMFTWPVGNLPHESASIMQSLFRRRRLPHWDIPDATYFITGCLADSIPAEVTITRQSSCLGTTRRSSARNSLSGSGARADCRRIGNTARRPRPNGGANNGFFGLLPFSPSPLCPSRQRRRTFYQRRRLDRTSVALGEMINDDPSTLE